MQENNSKRRQDRRTKYTREAIRNAFLRVKREKAYNAITVSDICRESEISRGTFYLHYNNIAELLNEILDEALSKTNELFAQLALSKNENKCAAYPFCHFVRNSVEYRCIFLDDALTTYIINHIAEKSLPGFTAQMEDKTDLNRSQIETLFYFQINGCFAISKRYAEMEKSEWKNIQCTVDDFLKNGFLAHMKN